MGPEDHGIGQIDVEPKISMRVSPNPNAETRMEETQAN
jgi:hypothetical protein